MTTRFMTEDEARKTWCPLALVRIANPNTETDAAGANRAIFGPQSRPGDNPLGTCMCLASGCQLWETIEPPEFKGKAEDEFRRRGIRMRTPYGYCGLRKAAHSTLR